MALSDRLLRQLTSIREMTEKMLAAFQTPEDWVYQIVPDTNHALWFAGHMATTDNYFISRIQPDRAKDFAGWDKLFGMGSKPTNDPDDYPPVAEIVDAMRERREVLMELLKGRSDAEMAAPPTTGASEYWPDLGSIFEMTTWHETLHLGQVSMARRALGNQPLFGAAPVEAAAT